jgi:hypothetical protein
MMMLAGCAASGSSKVIPVNLPPPPACMAAVPMPGIKAGDDARALVARHRSALAQANGNLDCSRKWYGKVRKGYAKGKSSP